VGINATYPTAPSIRSRTEIASRHAAARKQAVSTPHCGRDAGTSATRRPNTKAARRTHPCVPTTGFDRRLKKSEMGEFNNMRR
jgi:hypothetical protein